MKIEQKLIFDWPEMPPLPPLGQAILIRVVTSTSRQVARQELRAALCQILATWSGLLMEQLPLHETSHGPVWSGQIDDHNLDINLSHANGEGWIGLLRGGWIGVDAMRIQSVPEIEDVARHYLGDNALAAIRQSSDPVTAFATAWTELEARLKCLKRGLNEQSVTQATELAPCAVEHRILANKMVVAIASRLSTHF